MATRAFLAVISSSPNHYFISHRRISIQRHRLNTHRRTQCFSSDSNSSSVVLQPPDISRLAETARISLTASEIEECEPKIRQVIDWFGQLQEVDVNSVEPAIRAEMEGGNLREDVPETFENRDGIIASIPSFEDTFLKVPKVLNKE